MAPMKVAEFISDLTSLQVCDPNAALALVSARPEKSSQPLDASKSSNDDKDPDLQRAQDLLELHRTVKLAHQDGIDKELKDAREAVAKVLKEL